MTPSTIVFILATQLLAGIIGALIGYALGRSRGKRLGRGSHDEVAAAWMREALTQRERATRLVADLNRLQTMAVTGRRAGRA